MTVEFNPKLPNQFDVGLVPIEIRKKYFEEYTKMTPLSIFMGKEESKAIQMFALKNGQGETYTVSFSPDLKNDEPVKGMNQVEGSGQQVVVYKDTIKMEEMVHSTTLVGRQMVAHQTPINVFGASRPKLIKKQQKYLIKNIFDAGTINLYNPKTESPVDDRVLFAGKAKHEDSIVESCKAMTGAAYNKSGMSVAHIRELKAMADIGGHSFENEAALTPLLVGKDKGFANNTFALLIDTASYNSLCLDPMYNQQTIRTPIVNKDQPNGVRGKDYKGMIEGVEIYVCPELSKYRVKVSDGITASWNLLIGAQAFGVAWGERPHFVVRDRDAGRIWDTFCIEMRGQKALQFPSFKDSSKRIEHGIIHSFTQIETK